MIRSYRSYLILEPSWGTIEYLVECEPYARLPAPEVLDFDTPLPDCRKVRVAVRHFTCEVSLLSDLLQLPYFKNTKLTDYFRQDPAGCADLAAAALTWEPDNVVPLVVRDPDEALAGARLSYDYDGLYHPRINGNELEFFVRTTQLGEEKMTNELWSASLDLTTLRGRCNKLRTVHSDRTRR